MKHYRVLIVILLALTVITATDTMAQGKSKKKQKSEKRGGGPPPWAPAHGYRAKTRYVYFKDYPVYYDNDRGVYISLSGKNWSVSAKLPDILKGVDLLATPKIDLDFSGDDPQRDYDEHKSKYPKD
ncbi:MAG TPA: hypothetical protein VIN08_11915 [Ohtaekwangia sp.]|uniref:hypothetical protein n=1 Tax=Ohtaekwangia sp. TaxID=2066019 RepID=UPI002F95DC41